MCSLALASPSIPAQTASAEGVSPIRLMNGQSHKVTFEAKTASQSPLIWLRARIALPKGEQEGAYTLQLALNGTKLTLKNVAILNTKNTIYDRLKVQGKEKVLEGLPSFTEQSGAWYLKADSDYIPFNDTEPAGTYAMDETWNILAQANYRSHYYEYLFQPDSGLIRKGENTLELVSRIPEGLREYPVEISAISTCPAPGPDLIFLRPLEEFVFPEQAPALDDLVGNELKLSACAGEREPVSFSVFGLKPLEGLTFEVEPLVGQGVKRSMAPMDFQRYFVDSTEFKRLSQTLPWLEQAAIPQLLKPIEEGGVSLKAGHTKRFVLDAHLPEDLPPGQYMGTVVVRAGKEVLGRIPLHLEVYPFKLAAARQTYWMYRQQWTPIEEPDNVACIQDIKDHGFDGLALVGGASFKVTINADGSLKANSEEWERLAKVLKEAGLSNRVNDRSVQTAALSAAFKVAGIKGAAGEQWFAENVLIDPLTGQQATPKTAPVKPVDTKLVAEVKAKLPQIEKTMVQVMELARDEAKRIGLDLHLFPVDEPDGTSWRRAWTRFVADRAHQAGLKVWSTHNWPLNMGSSHWDSGLDESCMNNIRAFYTDPETIISSPFTGEMADTFHAIPIIGRMRNEPKYGFKGMIDEVRVYGRALTDEEILRQSEQPAKDGLLAYYPMDEGKGDVVADRSGNGHDAAVKDGAVWCDGKLGKGLSFGFSMSDRLQPPTKQLKDSAGWSISLWYNGGGTPFGSGYDYYCENGGQFLFRTDKGMQVLSLGRGPDSGFWNHLTVSIDKKTRQMKALVRNEEQRHWYQQNIKWVYDQARGFTMPYVRYQIGLMSWYCRYLDNITVFCYDWNTTPASNLCLVYPENYDRFANRPNTKWYGTLGWLAAREGIDDARYLQTLYFQIKQRTGDEQKAWEAVLQVLAPKPGAMMDLNRGTSALLQSFGGYDGMRAKVAGQIMKNMPEK